MSSSYSVGNDPFGGDNNASFPTEASHPSGTLHSPRLAIPPGNQARPDPYNANSMEESEDDALVSQSPRSSDSASSDDPPLNTRRDGLRRWARIRAEAFARASKTTPDEYADMMQDDMADGLEASGSSSSFTGDFEGEGDAMQESTGATNGGHISRSYGFPNAGAYMPRREAFSRRAVSMEMEMEQLAEDDSENSSLVDLASWAPPQRNHSAIPGFANGPHSARSDSASASFRVTKYSASNASGSSNNHRTRRLPSSSSSSTKYRPISYSSEERSGRASQYRPFSYSSEAMTSTPLDAPPTKRLSAPTSPLSSSVTSNTSTGDSIPIVSISSTSVATTFTSAMPSNATVVPVVDGRTPPAKRKRRFSVDDSPDSSSGSPLDDRIDSMTYSGSTQHTSTNSTDSTELQEFVRPPLLHSTAQARIQVPNNTPLQAAPIYIGPGSSVGSSSSSGSGSGNEFARFREMRGAQDLAGSSQMPSTDLPTSARQTTTLSPYSSAEMDSSSSDSSSSSEGGTRRRRWRLPITTPSQSKTSYLKAPSYALSASQEVPGGSMLIAEDNTGGSSSMDSSNSSGRLAGPSSSSSGSSRKQKSPSKRYSTRSATGSAEVELSDMSPPPVAQETAPSSKNSKRRRRSEDCAPSTVPSSTPRKAPESPSALSATKAQRQRSKVSPRTKTVQLPPVFSLPVSDSSAQQAGSMFNTSTGSAPLFSSASGQYTPPSWAKQSKAEPPSQFGFPQKTSSSQGMPTPAVPMMTGVSAPSTAGIPLVALGKYSHLIPPGLRAAKLHGSNAEFMHYFLRHRRGSSSDEVDYSDFISEAGSADSDMSFGEGDEEDTQHSQGSLMGALRAARDLNHFGISMSGNAHSTSMPSALERDSSLSLSSGHHPRSSVSAIGPAIGTSVHSTSSLANSMPMTFAPPQFQRLPSTTFSVPQAPGPEQTAFMQQQQMLQRRPSFTQQPTQTQQLPQALSQPTFEARPSASSEITHTSSMPQLPPRYRTPDVAPIAMETNAMDTGAEDPRRMPAKDGASVPARYSQTALSLSAHVGMSQGSDRKSSLGMLHYSHNDVSSREDLDSGSDESYSSSHETAAETMDSQPSFGSYESVPSTKKVSLLLKATSQLVKTYQVTQKNIKRRQDVQEEGARRKAASAPYYYPKLDEVLCDGRYRVVAYLGRGSFGVVVRAEVIKDANRSPSSDTDSVSSGTSRDPNDDSLMRSTESVTSSSTATPTAMPDMVAIKISRKGASFLQQGKHEVSLLEHIHGYQAQQPSGNDLDLFVRALDTFFHDGHFCIVFELLADSLFDLVKYSWEVRPTRPGLSLRMVRKMTHQLLCALITLRNMKIIHCDLKPENIALTAPNKPRLKVLDFGSSCFVSDAHLNQFPYIQSRYYRAPEVLLGTGYSCSIDMWSLGCIIAELYLGRPLFEGANSVEQVYCIIDVLGMPPDHVLRHAVHLSRYFQKVGVDVNGHSILDPVLKDFAFTNTNIRDLIESKNEPNTPLHVKYFTELLSRMLCWDPALRISPLEAVNHNFILYGPKSSNE